MLENFQTTLTLDIYIGVSGQDIEIQNEKCMPSVISLVIISHVHHLGTEMEGKNLQIVPKSTLINTNQVSATICFWKVKNYPLI